MAARSTASGSSSARRTRTKRATCSPLPSARAITSSGEGANRPRSTQAKPGRRPRARMSSLKLDRLASGCSSRVVATKLPEPWREVTSPRAVSSSRALRTVVRETSSRSDSTRSAGSASPSLNRPQVIAAAIRSTSCR